MSLRLIIQYLFLIGLCLLLYLPGIATIPLIDRDEPHFAQATRQMLQTDNFFQINFDDQPRHLKPPGIYWLQAFFVKIFSNANATTPWPYRLPSTLGATLAVLFTFAFTRKMYEDKTALLAAVLLACSLLLIVEAHLCVTDAALLATTVLMQGSLGLIYLQSKKINAKTSWIIALLFWLGMALNILIKGITPVIAGLTIIALLLADKDRKWIKSLYWKEGLLFVVIVTLIWLVPFSLAGKSNFLWDMIHKDLIPKVVGGQQSHGMPPGYFALIFTLMFWPGSLFFWHAVYQAWYYYDLPCEKFLLAWFVPTWIFFEIIPTKLPEYILPAYPAIAILSAAAIEAKIINYMPTGIRFINKVYYGIGLLFLLGLVFALIYIPYYLSHHLNYISLISALILLLMSLVSFYYVWQEKLIRAVKILVVTSVLSFGLIAQWVLPNLENLWLSENVARGIEKNNLLMSNQQLLQSIGYGEPSLVFMLGTHQVEFNDLFLALDKIAQGKSNLLLIDSQFLPQALQLANNKNLILQKVFEVQGLNINGGRRTTLYLYKKV